MKRVFQHPPESLTGKRYWRSLGELSDTPEFRGWLEREFPAGAAQLEGDEWSRRSFLKLMGASMALAGFGLNELSPARSASGSVHEKRGVGDSGQAALLRDRDAAAQRRDAARGHDASMAGRSRSMAIRCIRRAAAPPSLRAGFGSRSLRSGALADISCRQKASVNRIARRFEKYLSELRTKIAADGGAGLAFLVEETHSPTRERLRAELEKIFPQMRWCVYDPLLSEAQSFATQMSFGDNTRLVPQFERADVILALDSDFLELRRRRSRFGSRLSLRGAACVAAKDTMNRLYVVENRFTLTGAMADHRLRCPASQIPAFAHALAGKIAAATKDAGLGSVLATLKAPAKARAIRRALVDRSGQRSDVEAGREPGRGRPASTGRGAVAGLRNQFRAEECRDDADRARASPQIRATNSILQLAGDIDGGPDQTAFHFRRRSGLQRAARDHARSGNEDAARLARSAEKSAGCRSARLLRRCDFGVEPVACAGGALSRIVGRRAHCRRRLSRDPADDSAALRRDLGTRYAERAARADRRSRDRNWCRKHFAPAAPPGDFATAWSQVLARRIRLAHSRCSDKPPTFNGNTAGGVAHTLWSTDADRRRRIRPRSFSSRSYSMDDGRYINNGWLQEMPDPITKLTWDNAALMSPALCQALGVEDGDLDSQVDRHRTQAPDPNQAEPIQRQLVIAALISPGHADNSVTIPLGYGRKQTGPVGEEAGFNGYLLRTSSQSALHRGRRQGDRERHGRESCRHICAFASPRIIGASKAAGSCAKRRSSIIAKTTSS